MGDNVKYMVKGCIASIRDMANGLDEVECLIWFNGEDNDSTNIKITVPSGTFQLRDNPSVKFHKR